MKRTNKLSFIINTEGAINNSTLEVYLEELIPFIRYLGLTISPVLADINCAEVGDFISVGTSSEYDVDFIVRRGYITEKGYKPVLNITEDYNVIKKSLLDYAIGTNFSDTDETLCGDTVTFHRGFIKIDNDEGSTIIKNEELLSLAAKSVQLNLFFK